MLLVVWKLTWRTRSAPVSLSAGSAVKPRLCVGVCVCMCVPTVEEPLRPRRHGGVRKVGGLQLEQERESGDPSH